ncbi:intradiol ring-cleavage dioxygenase [Chryseobacterium sp. JJR-5R]|uniref:dioxygenase family protein n=1 Tax=Chryseobacterium sp. JJR-5R TaxID=3093923 RepID=UPI002A757489|nr:intradiol ring-cleavage dioxygenase [Chryseobacterium sp. JJR-5R]WPO83337.1 intradiol ring-cleavage dioxygenase [Chryseobacterium sp. JJR-5R]
MKTMNRMGFLKSLGLAGVAAVASPILIRCGSGDMTDLSSTDASSSGSGSASGSGSSATGCSVTNSETEGPFPTKSPSSLVQTNIVSDRTGVPFTIGITVQNTNAACANLQGAIVDIWHCDKDGNYSEYGGTGMQAANYTAVHFLRGRQTTDANGKVNFTSVFPGWYNGRATHIHVHIYNASGQSLLVTQIAFPEGSDSAVAQVAASTGYKGMNGYTYNANDNVFSDGTANEMSAVTGSVSGGFSLSHTIKVSA